MKNFVFILSVLLSISFLAFSCKGNKDASKKKGANSCEFEATVMDFTGLSGCSILLKLEDGTFVNPSSGVDREILKNAEKVSISYEAKSMVSNCMKGTIANITCFEVIKEGQPLKGKVD